MKKISYERIYKSQEYLSPLGEIHHRALFGGYTLAVDDAVFAMVSDGELYLRACEESAKYCVKNASSFLTLMKRGRPVLLNYYRVDDGLWQDRERLLQLSSFALSAARQRFDRAMLVGYARVSTQDQNLELQREALTQAGCQKLFEDKLSGTRAERPGLAKALEMLRKGDTLVVWKLDRLGRSVKQLVDLVSELHKQSIQFKSLTDAIDTGTPSGRFFFHVMASLAEMERELTVERTRAGLAVARLSGRKGGRKPKMTKSKIESAKKLLASGIAPKDVAKNLGVSIPTLYRWVPASGHAEQK